MSYATQYQCHCCGKKFASYAAEAKHRHNFPAMCNHRSKQWKAFQASLEKDKQDA